MDDRRLLLILTACAEGATGLCLLIAPALAFDLLLGAGDHPAETLFVGRFAGAALAGIGVASWMSGRSERDAVAAGLLYGLGTYNVAASMLLAYGGAAQGFSGILLWPATLTHAGLAAWCIARLRRPPAGAAPTTPA
jgi:hypothetical protein